MIGFDLFFIIYGAAVGKSDISIGINPADVRAFAIVEKNCVWDQ